MLHSNYLSAALCVLCAVTLTLDLASAQEVKTPQQETSSESNNEKQDEAATQDSPKSLKEKASFLAGYQFMKNARQAGVEFDLEQLFAGIRLAAEGKELGMDLEEINAINMAFRREVMKKQQEKMEKLAAENAAAGQAFIQDYAGKDGVTGPVNGLYYRVITPGKGTQPKSTDRVKVHFTGKSIDGKTLLSTAGREPAILNIATQIKGFVNSIQLMKTGAKWEVVIPPDQAFGKRGSRVFAPNQTVIYEIELIEIVQPENETAGDKDKNSDKAKDKGGD